MILTYSHLITFMLCSYATGWALIAHRARKKGIVDLCQFVRAFIFAPFVLVGAMFVGAVVGSMLILLWQNIGAVLQGVAIVTITLFTLGITGAFVVAPAVKKAHGIVKPFSEKICVVMHRGQK